MSTCTPSWLGARIEHLNNPQAESPQNSKEDWTTGNPDARLPSMTRGGAPMILISAEDEAHHTLQE